MVVVLVVEVLSVAPGGEELKEVIGPFKNGSEAQNWIKFAENEQDEYNNSTFKIEKVNQPRKKPAW